MKSLLDNRKVLLITDSIPELANVTAIYLKTVFAHLAYFERDR